MHPPIVIFAAVQPEAQAIRRKLGRTDDVELFAIGPRARRLPWDINADRASTIIVAGVAGALDASLRPGDVVVQGWPECVPLPAGARQGAIHTVETICATPRDKARLFRETGAAVVDMEHQIIAAACEAAGVPCIGVRAILDTAAECLDPVLLSLVDENGRARIGRAAAFVAKNPARIGELIRLGRATREATSRLGGAVGALVESLRTLPRASARG